MGKLLAVAVGGALGSLARYLIALMMEKTVSVNFPIATVSANLTGCLLIGFFWNYFDMLHINNEFRLFVFAGILGGFTTFSAFARESIPSPGAVNTMVNPVTVRAGSGSGRLSAVSVPRDWGPPSV